MNFRKSVTSLFKDHPREIRLAAKIFLFLGIIIIIFVPAVFCYFFEMSHPEMLLISVLVGTILFVIGFYHTLDTIGRDDNE
ncbi:MAG: hypothetical protein WCT49_00885 [Candidatus Paceibacterota bacterium]|jgi:RsiW-degrading membrane proteinase PrsW (M82 family)|nr:hypothetical protein [Candidatus Paceibacterota bacterium]